jgi:hypothetical protein
MKPRITKGIYEIKAVWGGRLFLPGWYCTHGAFREWGWTPKQAYDAWCTRCIGKWVEQHICPPKPTFWQRIKRGWDSLDFDVSARVF